MTLQQAKDQVARSKGYKDFADAEFYISSGNETRLHKTLEEAAELYAQSRESLLKEEIWNEACIAQFKNLALISFPPEIISIMKKQPIPKNPYLSSEEENEPLSAAKRLIKKYQTERDEARNVIQELEQKNKEMREILSECRGGDLSKILYARIEELLKQ